MLRMQLLGLVCVCVFQLRTVEATKDFEVPGKQDTYMVQSAAFGKQYRSEGCESSSLRHLCIAICRGTPLAIHQS